MTLFKRLLIHNWRQIGKVDIQFHDRLTILTGANGAGKTTILHLLNRHMGWNIPYVSSPRLSAKGIKKYWTGFWAPEDITSDTGSDPKHVIGSIEYHDHSPATLAVPENSSATFAVSISPQPSLPGVYVPSHRPLYLPHEVAEIPTAVDAKEQIFRIYLQEIQRRWSVGQKVASPSQMLKKSLISLATFGYGNEAVIANAEARRTFEGFEEVLRKVLPETLGFMRLRIRVPDVLLETSTGEFAFDAVSGGVAALIDMAWQIFLYSTLEEKFVVAIDEPEAHLHPAMQRAVIPSLLAAFPQAQFVVATHNPFVVGSSEESNVYVLRYGADKHVWSHYLDNVRKSGTASELLRDVLGMPSTSAIWVDDKLADILARFKGKPLTQSMVQELRGALSGIGLDQYLPTALDDVL